MAVVINLCSDEVYMGTLKVPAVTTITPGQVVVPNYSAGTAAGPANDTIGDAAGLFLVANYDSYADTDMTNTKDFTVGAGEYLRLKKLAPGDIFTTDQFIGTYASISVGDAFAVNGTSGSGAVGSWIAIGSRKPVLKTKVVAKTTLFGNNALKFIVE